jgi:TonB family protein
VQFNATASAQVSGDILVGAYTTRLAAVAPVPDEAGPNAPDVGSRPAGNLTEPRPVLLPQPRYPRAARAARQDGRVTVCFTVDERGRVQTPAVRASTDVVFNQPVLDAISASRFTPARFGEQAVRSTACRTFRFELR